MSAMNYKEIELVVSELQQLQGASVQRFHQPDEGLLIINLRHEYRKRLLLISVQDDACRLHLSETKPPSPKTPYAFVMLLRKLLEPSRVRDIQATQGERVVSLWLDTMNEAGEIHSYRLVAELTGRHANAFLLDENDRILGSLRPNRSKKRRLLVGETYHSPFPLASPPQVTSRIEAGEGDFPYNTAAALLFGVQAEEDQTEKRFTVCRKEIRRRLKKLDRVSRSLDKDEAGAQLSDEQRHQAELLQINFHLLKSRMDKIEVPDLLGEGQPVEIKLDPSLSPSDNISRLYQKSKKGKRAVIAIAKRREQIEEERDHLLRLSELLEERDEALLARVRKGLDLPDEEEQRSGTKKSREEEKRKPFRRFLSASGREIRVGRTDKENDIITFRLSKGDDVWFHASGYAGSHVIVPMAKGEQIDPETRIDAATLAAHYSKAKGGPVEVMIAFVRHVRKPARANPGQVLLSRHKAIYITPDAQRLQRLLASSKAVGK